MMEEGSSSAYRVVPDGDNFRVADANDRTILTLGDASSANHYVVLLNEAFKRGYRTGFKDGKTGTL